MNHAKLQFGYGFQKYPRNAIVVVMRLVFSLIVTSSLEISWKKQNTDKIQSYVSPTHPGVKGKIYPNFMISSCFSNHCQYVVGMLLDSCCQSDVADIWVRSCQLTILDWRWTPLLSVFQIVMRQISIISRCVEFTLSSPSPRWVNHFTSCCPANLHKYSRLFCHSRQVESSICYLRD